MRQNLFDSIAFDLFLKNGKLGSLFEILDGTHVVHEKSPVALFLDAGGVNRDVHLPVFAVGRFFFVCNIGLVGNLVVKTAGGGSTIQTLEPDQAGLFLSGPASWATMALSSGAAALSSGQIFLLRNVAGTATAITADTGFALSTLQEHQMFRFKPAANSTGATTIAIDGLTAVPLRSPVGAVLGVDDIHTGFYYDTVAIGSPVTELRICRF